EDKRLMTLESELEVGNQHFQLFLNQLAQEFAETKASTYGGVGALRETQALQSDLRELGVGTVALFTIVGEEKYRIIVVTPDAQIAREYSIGAAELNQKVLDFREAVQNPRTNPIAVAQELYKIIVGPVSRDLKQANATTILWSLDGALRYL